MKAWEAKNDHHLFELMVGDWYGKEPETNLMLMREDKLKRANHFIEELSLTSDSIVLEIGSGTGFTSKHVAKAIKKLDCCDISESFLTYAMKECKEIPNITFTQIPEPPLLPFKPNSYDAVFADAVFIHLNIFDIYWYFAEFDRVVRNGGLVWINVMDDSQIDQVKLKEMATYYFEDRTSLKTLLCWNSVNAVIEVAAIFGFSIVSKHYQVSVSLKFVKNK